MKIPQQRYTSRYSHALADRILEQLSLGRTLIAICRDPDMPAESSVRKWVDNDYYGFGAKYARARLAGYHRMAEELLEVADEKNADIIIEDTEVGPVLKVQGEVVNRSRLRYDARKWLLSKALPKIYGDKLDIDMNVSARQLTDDQLEARIQLLLEKRTNGTGEGDGS